MTFEAIRDRLRQRPNVPLFVGEEPWDDDLDQLLQQNNAEALFPGQEIQDASAAAAVVSGLLLWNDNFETSHDICQGLKNSTGSYWHMLCHRREGHLNRGLEANLPNTRHWVRSTGDHPAFPRVLEAAVEAMQSQGGGFRWATENSARLQSGGKWQPSAMVDWIAEVEAGTLSPETRRLLEQIQLREIETLLDWCVEQAVGA